MITQQAYDILKEEHGFTSSWAVWSAPANGNWKSKDSVSDMAIFSQEEELLNILNGRYIFVGLNPAAHDHAPHAIAQWENFHSGDAKRSQDYKLRYALQGTQYWGAFITDVYTGIVDTDSSSAMRKVTKRATNESVNNVLRIRELLGGTATIVAMGTKAFAVLKKHLPDEVDLKMITHYSAYVNIEEYRSMVLQQLGEQIEVQPKTIKSTFEVEDIRKLYDAFITLCDYTEEEIGCGKCPLYDELCGAKDKTAVKSFSEALARIRKAAGIPDPQS